MIGMYMSTVLLFFGLAISVPASAQSCCLPTTGDFPKVGGNFGNDNYSSLDKINRSNVARLGGAWHTHLENGSRDEFQESTVVAVGGVLYVETTQGSVLAIDGKTGATKWTFHPGYGQQLRRGVAVGQHMVFTATAGLHVVALNQETGSVVWDMQLGDEGLGSLKTAMTYFDGLVYVGTSDSVRGAALALDATTGKVIWKVYGTPAEGEPGNKTWEGDSWKVGGASPWMHPAIDPKLGLVYFTFGNARRQDYTAVSGSERAGQNLYANSLVALNAKTGKMAWYFQSVHHDIWDLDNVMSPVLFDAAFNGKLRSGIVYGSKTGMLYILDRATGTPLTPIDETPVPQEVSQKTWPTQPIPRGDSLIPLCPTADGGGDAPPYYQSGCIFTPFKDAPVVTYPGTGGGGCWGLLSYDPKTKFVYAGIDRANSAHSLPDGGIGFRPLGEYRSGRLIAFDPVMHKIAWHKDMEWGLAHGDGILTTKGDVMFLGLPDGRLLGLDVMNGKALWKFQTGAGVQTSPITYEIDGEQYIAVLAGGGGIGYISPKGDDLWAFKIGGHVAEAKTPVPPSIKQPILATPVEGSVVHDTVLIGRTWRNGSVSSTESTTESAMAPQKLRVPLGTTVTFTNPSSNITAHCVTQFYEGLFNSGQLQPGQSFTFTFKQQGEYYYNDCRSPRTTGEVVVY